MGGRIFKCKDQDMALFGKTVAQFTDPLCLRICTNHLCNLQQIHVRFKNYFERKWVPVMIIIYILLYNENILSPLWR